MADQVAPGPQRLLQRHRIEELIFESRGMQRGRASHAARDHIHPHRLILAFPLRQKAGTVQHILARMPTSDFPNR